jgi:hypothetical protein
VRLRRKLIPIMWGRLVTVGNLRRIGNPPVGVQKIVRPIANRPQDAILSHTTNKVRAKSSRRAKKQRISNTGIRL